MNPKNNDYGERWHIGDIVTVLLDLDAGEISYLLNGRSHGVAFSNVSRDIEWWPSISLASDQGCEVFFGGPLDPLTYHPESFSVISSEPKDPLVAPR